MTPSPEAQLRIMDRLLAETKAENDRLRVERDALRAAVEDLWVYLEGAPITDVLGRGTTP